MYLWDANIFVVGKAVDSWTEIARGGTKRRSGRLNSESDKAIRSEESKPESKSAGSKPGRKSAGSKCLRSGRTVFDEQKVQDHSTNCDMPETTSLDNQGDYCVIVYYSLLVY